MKTLSRIRGFTMLMDNVVQDFGLVTAAVYGNMSRYFNMDDGVCKASLETIASRIKVDRATVLRHIKVLEDNGYIRDLTPDLRNKPHTYVDTGKMRALISVAVAQDNTLLQGAPPTVAESDLKKVLKIHSKKETPAILENADIAWQILVGESSESIEKSNKIFSEENDKLIKFEKDMRFGTLPWGKNVVWTRFMKFVLKEMSFDPECFARYVTERIKEGKFSKRMTNERIRDYPETFMDTFAQYREEDKPQADIGGKFYG